MKFIVLHSTNTRDTGCFTIDEDNDVFNADMARAAVKAYKACACPEMHEGVYKFAGIVDVENGLQDVFEASQNLFDKAWGDGKQRSTMVGDAVIGVNDDYSYAANQVFIVESFGYCQLMGV